MKKKIYLSPPHLSGDETKYINAAMETNWIAPGGPNVKAFERVVCKYIGTRHAVALSSGTAALHLALMVLGVETGDEVLAPTFTFAATINPIIYQNARPVLIDSEPDTWNMCPELLRKAIEDRLSFGKKPKAIIVVHLYGMPARLAEILQISNEYDIPVIEDAAEALGSTYEGKHLGTFGTVGIFSFNGNKIITTSGGGMLVSDHPDYIQQAGFLANQAKDKAPHYQHSHIGYNYAMSNISAGIGRGQMEVIDERVAARRKNYNAYQEALAGVPAISFLPEPTPSFHSNRWLTTLLIDPKLSAGTTPPSLLGVLSEFSIEARPLWKPMHMQPIFKDCRYFGDRLSESLFSQGLCLPSGSNLQPQQLTQICRLIHDQF